MAIALLPMSESPEIEPKFLGKGILAKVEAFP